MAKRVFQDNDSLAFEINSVINTTKNGETKICKAVQELQVLVKTNNGKDRSTWGRPKDGKRPRFLSW